MICFFILIENLMGFLVYDYVFFVIVICFLVFGFENRFKESDISCVCVIIFFLICGLVCVWDSCGVSVLLVGILLYLFIWVLFVVVWLCL